MAPRMQVKTEATIEDQGRQYGRPEVSNLDELNGTVMILEEIPE